MNRSMPPIVGVVDDALSYVNVQTSGHYGFSKFATPPSTIRFIPYGLVEKGHLS